MDQSSLDNYSPNIHNQRCMYGCYWCLQVIEAALRLQLEFNTHSLLALLHFFKGTILSASTVILLEEEGSADAAQARVEAITGIG